MILAGAVTDAQGRPVPDVSVYLKPAPDGGATLPPDWGWVRLDHGFVQGAVTGADGAYRVERLPAGAYVVVAVRAGQETAERSPEIVVQAGRTDLQLTLPR